MTDTCRKTFKYQLDPTPEQAAKMDWTLWRCRELYNAALQERKEAWQQSGVSIGYYDQQNQLPAIKEVRPEYRDIHTHVLQDVVRRLDKAMQAFLGYGNDSYKKQPFHRVVRTGKDPKQHASLFAAFVVLCSLFASQQPSSSPFSSGLRSPYAVCFSVSSVIRIGTS